MDKKTAGRPSNEKLIAQGKFIVSKACKICQSDVRDEITQDILNKVPSSQIIESYNSYFIDNPLTPTNIHSHKQHVSPETAVQQDRKRAIALSSDYSPETKELYAQKYHEQFDKLKASDNLYKQRLNNLFHLQAEIETLNQLEEENGGVLTESNVILRRSLIVQLEDAYRGFNQDLLKHIALDADLYTKQISVQFIKAIQGAYTVFIEKFMDVVVKEIPDALVRERVQEQLGDLLDTEVAPVLDPKNALPAVYAEVED